MPNHRKNKKHFHGKKAHQPPAAGPNAANRENHKKINPTSSSVYDVKESDVMGRYIVANKHIKAGDIIIEENALVIGPPVDWGPVCLGCLRAVEFSSSQYRCPNCQWPLCTPTCPGLGKDQGHTKSECDILKEKKVAQIMEKYNSTSLKVAYEIILQLRCLLLKIHDKCKWDNLIQMESHNETRKEVSWLWTRNQTLIVNRIRDEWGFDTFTDEEIHTVCGIIEVNCFEIGQMATKGRALYPTSFLMAHDCSPNAKHIDDPDTFSMVICAVRDVEQGESITVNYGYIFMGTLNRREHLHTGKFFWCTCQRCTDPTELGTYCSGLKCSNCATGTILPTNPLDQDGIWKCGKCSFSLEAKTVSTMLIRLFDELDSIDPHDVENQEHFIEKYNNVLSPNHYLILSAKYTLCQLYGRVDDFLVDSLSEDQLQRKETYCRDVLKAINLLEPGLSRIKGIVMYELHVPLLLLAGNRIQKGNIDNRQFKKCLKEVVSLLEESSKILKVEPGTKEKELVHGAEMALTSLKLQNLKL